MAHKQKKDPFVPIAFLIGLAILGTVVFVLVSNLLNTISNNSTKGAEDHSRQEAVITESLKPIGNVTTTADVPKGGSAVASAATGTADGEAVYKGTCFACHATGAAGSPVFGNKEQWKPRVATGLAALLNSALHGKGAMPAKGGNAALSEAEVKAAIIYMTKKAGFDLTGGDTAAKKEESAKDEARAKEKTPATKATAKDEAPATKTTAKDETVKEEATTATPTKPEPVVKPKKPETPATPTTPAVPDAPKAPATKETEPATTKTEAPTAKEATPAATKTEAPATETKKATKSASSANGEAVYNGTCFACHKTGVAGAPVFGNKNLWAPRIAKGMDALFNSALKGKGAMPPKGGNGTLSDDEVKAAVAYMVEHGK